MSNLGTKGLSMDIVTRERKMQYLTGSIWIFMLKLEMNLIVNWGTG
jgi:hypothetical protein